MKILGDRVLLRLDDPDNKTASGIIVKKSWEDARNKGIVEGVGIAVTKVKKDDHVQINPYAVLETPEKNVVFIREDDILVVL
jgi:co-chaperonin GroES (HSP10)